MNPIASIIGLVSDGLDKLFTSDKERAEAKITLERLRQQPQLMQAAINANEASNKNMFVAGWRPFIGWVCGCGLAYEFLLRPFGVALGLNMLNLDISSLMGLVISMLGLGAYRSFDKINGTTKTYGVDLPAPRDTR